MFGDDENGEGIANEADQANPVPEDIMEPIPITEVSPANVLWPASPNLHGEGLPYAPVDWPNDGDIWMWRVGKRISTNGFFKDRFLYPPKHILRPGQPKFLASKVACSNLIKSISPDVDVDAFFRSFTWKIPAKCVEEKDVSKEETTPSSGKRVIKSNDKYVIEEEKERRTDNSGSGDMRKRRNKKNSYNFSAKNGTPGTGKSSGSSKTKRAKFSATPQVKTSESAKRSSRSVVSSEEQEELIDPIPEDFDQYLDSLEHLFSQSQLHLVPCNTLSNRFAASEAEIYEARAKLSSLLTEDLTSLLFRKNAEQLRNLASTVRKDPILKAEQLVKLKLIDEISLFSEVYFENLQATEEVDKFLSDVEDNKSRVSYMRKEYQELKDKAFELQRMIDFNRAEVEEIDRQIDELEARGDELRKEIETTKITKVGIVSNQKMLASAIPEVVEEIQSANAKIPEMEEKAITAQKLVDEILHKFSSLKGFVL